MKNLLHLVVITAFLGILFTACAWLGDSTFTIKVSGSSGLQFNGNYIVVTFGGQSASQSVEGIVPAQYTVHGKIVSVAIQKQPEYGTLRVDIIKEGEIVAQSETSAAYGVVSIATP